MRLLITLCVTTMCCPSRTEAGTAAEVGTYDVVVYGGTSAAVTAAVQAKRIGKSVVIVSPDTHLGGLSSGGLGFTDTGNKAVIGGLSREFYHRVLLHYDGPQAGRWQGGEEDGGEGPGGPPPRRARRGGGVFAAPRPPA